MCNESYDGVTGVSRVCFWDGGRGRPDLHWRTGALPATIGRRSIGPSPSATFAIPDVCCVGRTGDGYSVFILAEFGDGVAWGIRTGAPGRAGAASVPAASIAASVRARARMTISTRRLMLRPSAVRLVATG